MSESNGTHVDPGFVFDDLEPKVWPVRIGGKDYVLKSAGTGASVKYRNACARAAKWDGNPTTGSVRVTGFDNLADSEVVLVQSCTFEVIRDRGQVRHGAVSRGWVESLPPAVTAKLFAKIVELSPMLKGVEDTPTAPAAGDLPEEPLPKDSHEPTTSTS